MRERVRLSTHKTDCQPAARVPTCHRCGASAAGLVTAAELHAGRAAHAVADVPLYAACLAVVALACGFEAPAVLEGQSRR